MRKMGLTLEEVKQKIKSLKGENITLAINRGRKKIDTVSATIENIYPSVFTVKVNQINQKDTQTFSYFDVLCGDVEIV
ncbi:MAG: Veg family protein [Clostridia bacterium]|nr:Veg family protein [Clostridia bacterium]